MTYYSYFFNAIELFAFILPALPSQLSVRLLILAIYFIGHYYKLQYRYAKFKSDYLKNNNKTSIMYTS